MALSAGHRLGPYEVLGLLGAGGMGEVYLARDARLDRGVAVKVLPAEVWSDARWLKRFEREARAASALNHPNIVTIYEIGEIDSVRFMAMERVEGESLREVLRSGACPPRRILDITAQIAAGLAKAHEAGIVHRDLKPENIMVTTDGLVKILDFGLAKLTRAASDGEGISKLPTWTGTGLGMVVGTIAYMSPEQASGQIVDVRSDQFSFGSIAYEMVTGRKPFLGATAVDVLSAILHDEPEPVGAVNPVIPAPLCWVVERCHAKDPDERYESTSDLARELANLRLRFSDVSSSAAISTAHGPRRRAPRWMLPTLVTVVAVLLALLIGLSWPKMGPRRSAQAPLPVDHRQITFEGTARGAEISPDGQFLAYVASNPTDSGHERLMVQDLSGGNPLEVFRGPLINRQRWSPDGGELLVWRVTEPERFETWLVPRLGGTPRDVRVNVLFAWSNDGRHFASTFQNWKEITITEKATDSTSTVPLERPFSYLLDMDWSPVGDVLALLIVHEEEGRSAIWTTPLVGGSQKAVVEERSELLSPRWSGDGSAIYYLVSRDRTADLWKVRVDPHTGRATSGPAVVRTGLDTTQSFSLSRDGRRLAYAKERKHSNLWRVTVSREAGTPSLETTQLTFGTSLDEMARLSPDGRRVAFVRRGDIYTMPFEGGPVQRLTFTEARESSPAWSPDGTRIAFGSDEGETPRVWTISAQGGTARPFEKTKVSRDNLYVTWAPGARILYQRPGNRNFHLLDPKTEDETPLIGDDSVGWAFGATYSPDGGRVAVNWNRPQPDGSSQLSVWTISVESSRERHISEKPAHPTGWCGDGTCVYAVRRESGSARTMRIPTGGGDVDVAFEWPFENQDASCSPGPEGVRWLCEVRDSTSDVWVMENFDPEAR